MEGRLDGYIKFQENFDSIYWYKISAMYSIDINWKIKSEPSRNDNFRNIKGTIEGMISRYCKEL